MIKLIGLLFIFSFYGHAADEWRLEVVSEGGLDVMRVFNEHSASKNPLIKVFSEGADLSFKEAEEIYIESVKKHYLVTRWHATTVGGETLKIYDPESKSSKEVYRLDTLPSQYTIKKNKVIFKFLTAGKPYKTEWVPRATKTKAAGNPSAPQNP